MDRRTSRSGLSPSRYREASRNTDTSASQGALLAPPIRIQTSEGYQVTVDVAIAYRIIDPVKLQDLAH